VKVLLPVGAQARGVGASGGDKFEKKKIAGPKGGISP